MKFKRSYPNNSPHGFRKAWSMGKTYIMPRAIQLRWGLWYRIIAGVQHVESKPNAVS